MKLTKRTVDGLEPRGRRYTVWDETLARFGVTVETSGSKTFVMDYDGPDGRRRRMTLGRFGALTVDQAKDRRVAALAKLVSGADPLQTKQDLRTELTLREFAGKYLDGSVRTLKKPRTEKTNRDMLERLILPKLGSRKLSTVAHVDVRRLHRGQSEHPVQANRMLATLSHVYSVAAKEGYLPAGVRNPCKGVDKFREPLRDRHVETEELNRLGPVLAGLEEKHPHEVRALRLLLLTGCRLNEILSLSWDDVDFENCVLRLRDAKAGPRQVPLGSAAVELLQAAWGDRQKRIEGDALEGQAADGDAATSSSGRRGQKPRKVSDQKADASPWVVPSRSRPGRHLVNLHMFWSQEVLPAANLATEDKKKRVRLHDCRHLVGNVGADAGLSELMIAKVLGHSQTSTTRRYATIGNTQAHVSAEIVSRSIAEALAAKPPAKAEKSVKETE